MKLGTFIGLPLLLGSGSAVTNALNESDYQKIWTEAVQSNGCAFANQ